MFYVRLSKLLTGTEPPEDRVKDIRKVFEDGGLTFKKAPENDPDRMDILWFVPNSAITRMAEAVKNEGKLAATIASILNEKPCVPDIALSGRMTEFDSKGHFKDLPSFRVEAALAVAHAISTHEVINEVDYFTAVDDLATGTGAGYLDEAMLNSACFYKYFQIDWAQLVRNLGDNVDLAKITVTQFLYGAALSTPSGKQKSFAAFNPPEGILVEVKTEERAVPISYANAFADPVPPKTLRGLVGESIARLGQYVHETSEGFGINATRFWFSPGGRHGLTWIDHKKVQKPVIDGDGNIGKLEDLVTKVMGTVS